MAGAEETPCISSGRLLAIVVAALSVSLLGSSLARQRAVEANLTAVRAREAAEQALALRLLELQNGDRQTLERTYPFANRAQATVVLHPYTPTRYGLEISAQAGLTRTRLLALIVGETETRPLPVSRGNLFLVNDLELQNNNTAPLPFDSRLGLPSAANSFGRTRIFANRTVTMTNQSKVFGTVAARTSISLSNNSLIADTARAPSVVATNHASYGVLDTTPPAAIPLPSYNALIDAKLAAALPVAQNRGNVTIPNKGHVQIGPHEVVRYGSFSTSNQGVLSITGPATVIFGSLLVNNTPSCCYRATSSSCSTAPAASTSATRPRW